MSTPNFDDFLSPMGEKQAAKLIGQISAQSHLQATAADLVGAYLWTATFPGVLNDFYVTASAACASGESCTFDLLKNGVSVLSAVGTLDSTSTNNQVNLFSKITAAGRAFTTGDVFTVTRDYTAGGGPTPLANTVVTIEPSTKDCRYLAMDQLRSLFFNPPKGGNEHGVRTTNVMVQPPPEKQPHIGANFVQGETMARSGKVESSKAGAGDMRNFERGEEDATYSRYDVHVRPADTVYESEAMQARRDQLETPPVSEQPTPQKVEPALVPARQQYRSDGKPL